MSDSLSICVFSASSEEVPAEDRATARGLGVELAARGWQLVYGGGGVGLMGEVARGALSGGAHVVGVIPRKLVGREVALHDVPELIVTETMRERQRIMDERSDAFCVLPGGLGTLAELLEIITLRQLGYHDRPVVLLDPDGYWQPLHDLLAAAVARGCATSACQQLMRTATTVREALDAAAEATAIRQQASAPSAPKR